MPLVTIDLPEVSWGIMEHTETDASLAGTNAALIKVVSLLIGKLKDSGIVDAAWIEATRAECLRSFARPGGDSSDVADDPGLNSAHTAIIVLFSAGGHQGPAEP